MLPQLRPRTAPIAPFLSLTLSSSLAVVGACGPAPRTVANTPSDAAQTPPPAPAPAVVADVVLHNARIYTLAWPDPLGFGAPNKAAPWSNVGWHPDATSIAIADGEIVGVGREQDLQKFVASQTRLRDMRGATVVPGLIDSHTHVIEMGKTMDQPDLRDLTSIEAMVSRLKGSAANSPPDQWLLARGFDEGAWANAYPDRSVLDAAFPERPVYVRGLHGFAGWLNSAALAQLGIDASTPPPKGGRIIVRKGRATGIVLDNAVDLVDSKIPPLPADRLEAAIVSALDSMATAGFVGVHEAGVGRRELAALERLAAAGRLPIRVYAMLDGTDRELLERWRLRGPTTTNEGRLIVRAVKGYYDGSLGARGAALISDYADSPGHRGVAGAQYEFDAEHIEKMADAGFQLAIHAIGDLGNREVLDFLAALEPRPDARHRIEHAQLLTPVDLRRFAGLGIIASMEAVHCVEDAPWVHDRVGAERARGAYAWRSLRVEGTALTFNSDLPGSSHDIFYGLHSAVTRQNPQGQPEGGFHPAERLTIEESLRAYTSWSAYAEFAEGNRGSLEVGKAADLTVMDIDPFVVAQSDPRQLLTGKIVATMVDGVFVAE